MITLFEKYNPINKPNYDLIIIKVINESQSQMIQELCFKNGICWSSGDCEYYIVPSTIFYFNVDLLKGKLWFNYGLDNEDWLQDGYNIDPTIYTFDDFVKIATILKYGADSPSYKPKKIIRESVERKRYPYDEITIKVNDEFEVHQLVNLLREINHIDYNIVDYSNLYPNYIFVTNVNTHLIDNRFYTCYLSDTNNDVGTLYDLAFSDPRVDRDILTIKDSEIIKSILLYGERRKTPSYKPRIIDRTLENNKNKLYDIVVFEVKNPEENKIAQSNLFKNGYKWSFGVPSEYRHFDDKDYPVYLFVSDYEENNEIEFMRKFPNTGYPTILNYIKSCNEDYNENICPKVFNFCQTKDIDLILLKGDIIPSYKPKKIDRTLESINTNYLVLTNNRDDSVNFEDYLHKKGYFWIGNVTHHIKNDDRIRKVLFVNIDTTNKIFSGYDYDLITEKWIDEKFPNNVIFKYPDDISKINDMLMIKPSYKPRKIDRTLESNNQYLYKTVVFEVLDKDENEKAQKDLIKLGYKWGSGRDIILFDKYPAYLFVDKQDYSISYFVPDAGITTHHKNINNYINYLNDHNICTMVFSYNDIIHIEKIFKYGMISPSYKPRKIDRTLESNVFYPYRFKTEEEFIEEFGEDWKDALIDSGGPNWTTAGEMDHLFGKDFPFKENELNLTDSTYPIDGRWNDPESIYNWLISWDMLTKNKPIQPSYKPKKIDRTLESLNFEEYLKKLKDNYGDEDTAKQTLDQYKEDIEEIQKNGGELYRIVFLKDKSELEDDKLGEHWTLYKDDISRFFYNIKVENDEVFPYLITGKFSPNSIEEESSWETFIQIPDEQEVNIKKEPISYKIEPYFYDYTWKILFIQQQILDYYGFERDEWEDFINNQEMGDCQFITKLVVDLAKENNISGVDKVFGHIELDEPYYNVEEDEETDVFTHHWNIIDGEIVEFSKGTLKQYIEWNNLYDTLSYFEEHKYKEL